MQHTITSHKVQERERDARDAVILQRHLSRGAANESGTLAHDDGAIIGGLCSQQRLATINKALRGT